MASSRHRLASPAGPKLQQGGRPRPGRDDLGTELLEDRPVGGLARAITAEIEDAEIPSRVANDEVVRLQREQGHVSLVHEHRLASKGRGILRPDHRGIGGRQHRLDPLQLVRSAIRASIPLHLEDPELEPDLDQRPIVRPHREPDVDAIRIEGPLLQPWCQITLQTTSSPGTVVYGRRNGTGGSCGSGSDDIPGRPSHRSSSKLLDRVEVRPPIAENSLGEERNGVFEPLDDPAADQSPHVGRLLGNRALSRGDRHLQ